MVGGSGGRGGRKAEVLKGLEVVATRKCAGNGRFWPSLLMVLVRLMCLGLFFFS